jgi:hypothetical protein
MMLVWFCSWDSNECWKTGTSSNVESVSTADMEGASESVGVWNVARRFTPNCKALQTRMTHCSMINGSNDNVLHLE